MAGQRTFSTFICLFFTFFVFAAAVTDAVTVPVVVTVAVAVVAVAFVAVVSVAAIVVVGFGCHSIGGSRSCASSHQRLQSQWQQQGKLR